MVDSSRPLESLLETMDEAVDGEDTDLKAMMEAFGDRAFGPVLSFSGLIMVTPLGAVPGVPLALAIIIVSFSAQLLLGRSTPWLPEVLRKVKLKKSKITKVRRQLKPVLKRVDGFVRPRLPWASHKYVRMLASIICIILALMLIPLGAIPFGVVVPGIIIMLIGLGIMARDGLMLIAALILMPVVGSLILALI